MKRRSVCPRADDGRTLSHGGGELLGPLTAEAGRVVTVVSGDDGVTPSAGVGRIKSFVLCIKLASGVYPEEKEKISRYFSNLLKGIAHYLLMLALISCNSSVLQTVAVCDMKLYFYYIFTYAHHHFVTKAMHSGVDDDVLYFNISGANVISFIFSLQANGIYCHM